MRSLYPRQLVVLGTLLVGLIQPGLFGCQSNETDDLAKRVDALEASVLKLRQEVQMCRERTPEPPPKIEEKLDELISKIDNVESLKSKELSVPPPVPLQEPTAVTPIPPMPTPESESRNQSVSIGLSKSEVTLVMNRVKQKVRLCGLKSGATITFNIRVAPTGRILEALPLKPHQDSPVGNCAAKVVYGILFPATGKESVFSHTFAY